MGTSLLIIFIFSGIGLLLSIIGILFYNFPPKKINAFYGYRTSTSLSSQEKWDFAQRYSSKIMLWIGIILALSWIPFYFLNIAPHIFIIFFLAEMLLLFGYMIFKTENALKEF